MTERATTADLYTASVEHDEQAGIVVTLTMPLPPASLGKNGRASWFQRARDYRGTRDAAAWVLAAALVGRDLPLWDGPVALVIHWFAARWNWIPDNDNCINRCQVLIDGAQVAALYANDRQIERINARRYLDPANPRVVLEWQGMEDS